MTIPRRVRHRALRAPPLSPKSHDVAVVDPGEQAHGFALGIAQSPQIVASGAPPDLRCPDNPHSLCTVDRIHGRNLGLADTTEPVSARHRRTFSSRSTSLDDTARCRPSLERVPSVAMRPTTYAISGDHVVLIVASA